MVDEDGKLTAIYLKRYSRLLAILQGKRGQWITRGEIANALGRKTFSGDLVLSMEALESVGLIESRRVNRRSWEYRIKSKIDAIDLGL